MKRLKQLPKYKYRFERVVFIDSTWHQVNKISSDERLRGSYFVCLQFTVYVDLFSHVTFLVVFLHAVRYNGV